MWEALLWLKGHTAHLCLTGAVYSNSSSRCVECSNPCTPLISTFSPSSFWAALSRSSLPYFTPPFYSSSPPPHLLFLLPSFRLLYNIYEARSRDERKPLQTAMCLSLNEMRYLQWLRMYWGVISWPLNTDHLRKVWAEKIKWRERYLL